ncbi:MAG: hypothetical protein COT85_06090 [Chlamydiae bacterium CG10_big_fil_rev_8_21_14_0_10_42_34]|nr:MAG: hypothetical protein COT85_06090 [Chlamydiae bacterium CG10_big_fil_rev_8_21_14_0_10_42_34]
MTTLTQEYPFVTRTNQPLNGYLLDVSQMGILSESDLETNVNALWSIDLDKKDPLLDSKLKELLDAHREAQLPYLIGAFATKRDKFIAYDGINLYTKLKSKSLIHITKVPRQVIDTAFFFTIDKTEKIFRPLLKLKVTDEQNSAEEIFLNHYCTATDLKAEPQEKGKAIHFLSEHFLNNPTDFYGNCLTLEQRTSTCYSWAKQIFSSIQLYDFGIALRDSKSEPLNTEATFHWFSLLQKDLPNDVHINYELGRCYENGIGTEQLFPEALKYYALAIETPQGSAAYNRICPQPAYDEASNAPFVPDIHNTEANGSKRKEKDSLDGAKRPAEDDLQDEPAAKKPASSPGVDSTDSTQPVLDW